MATIGNLVISITAPTGKLKGQMNAAVKITDGFEKKITQAGRTLKRFGQIALAVAAGGGLAALTKSVIESADSLQKIGMRLGITTEKLAGLRLAGRLSGVEINQLQLGLQRMTRRIAEAAKGMGEAQGAIKDLGLSAEDLNKLTPDEQFRVIAEAMQNVTEQSEKVRLGFKLFDSEGVSLIQTMEGGAMALRKAEQQAKKFGTALSEVEAGKLAEVKDEITLLKENFLGLASQMLIKFKPALETIIKAAADFLDKLRALSSEQITQIANWGKFILKLFLIIKVVKLVISVFRSLITVWRAAAKAKAALLALAGPKGWAILAAAAAITVSAGLAIDHAFDKLKETVDGVNTSQAEAEGQMKKTTEQVIKQQAAITGLTDAQKKRLEVIKAQQSKLASEAKRVFDATRTPMEKFVAVLARLTMLLNTSKISWDTYGRAVKKARMELKSAESSKSPAIKESPAALRRGSQGAFAAIDKAQKGSQANEERIKKENVEQTKLQRQMLEALKTSLGFSKDATVNVVDIGP